MMQVLRLMLSVVVLVVLVHIRAAVAATSYTGHHWRCIATAGAWKACRARRRAEAAYRGCKAAACASADAAADACAAADAAGTTYTADAAHTAALAETACLWHVRRTHRGVRSSCHDYKGCATWAARTAGPSKACGSIHAAKSRSGPAKARICAPRGAIEAGARPWSAGSGADGGRR